MKICKNCDHEKELECFTKRKCSIDGYSLYCRDCIKLSKAKKKEQYKEYSKSYYKNNPDYFKIKSKEWYNDNKLDFKEYYRIYSNKKYHSDENYKLGILLRGRLLEVLKKNKTRKSKRALELLGCSVNNLKIYLESKFKPDMSWSNHGKIWEIDHIIPCSKFKLVNLEEQQKCFHFTNLQPLYKLENRRKSNK